MKATRFTTTVFLAAAVFLGLLLIYSLDRDVPKDYTSATRALLASLLALSLVSLKPPFKYKVRLSLVFVSTGIALLGAEILLDIVEARATSFLSTQEAAIKSNTNSVYKQRS